MVKSKAPPDAETRRGGDSAYEMGGDACRKF